MRHHARLVVSLITTGFIFATPAMAWQEEPMRVSLCASDAQGRTECVSAPIRDAQELGVIASAGCAFRGATFFCSVRQNNLFPLGLQAREEK